MEAIKKLVSGKSETESSQGSHFNNEAPGTTSNTTGTHDPSSMSRHAAQVAAANHPASGTSSTHGDSSTQRTAPLGNAPGSGSDSPAGFDHTSTGQGSGLASQQYGLSSGLGTTAHSGTGLTGHHTGVSSDLGTTNTATGNDLPTKHTNPFFSAGTTSTHSSGPHQSGNPVAEHTGLGVSTTSGVPGRNVDQSPLGSSMTDSRHVDNHNTASSALSNDSDLRHSRAPTAATSDVGRDAYHGTGHVPSGNQHAGSSALGTNDSYPASTTSTSGLSANTHRSHEHGTSPQTFPTGLSDVHGPHQSVLANILDPNLKSRTNVGHEDGVTHDKGHGGGAEQADLHHSGNAAKTAAAAPGTIGVAEHERSGAPYSTSGSSGTHHLGRDAALAGGAGIGAASLAGSSHPSTQHPLSTHDNSTGSGLHSTSGSAGAGVTGLASHGHQKHAGTGVATSTSGTHTQATSSDHHQHGSHGAPSIVGDVRGSEHEQKKHEKDYRAVGSLPASTSTSTDPAPTTTGPHKHDWMNKLDPRVHSKPKAEAETSHHNQQSTSAATSHLGRNAAIAGGVGTAASGVGQHHPGETAFTEGDTNQQGLPIRQGAAHADDPLRAHERTVPGAQKAETKSTAGHHQSSGDSHYKGYTEAPKDSTTHSGSHHAAVLPHGQASMESVHDHSGRPISNSQSEVPRAVESLEHPRHGESTTGTSHHASQHHGTDAAAVGGVGALAGHGTHPSGSAASGQMDQTSTKYGRDESALYADRKDTTSSHDRKHDHKHAHEHDHKHDHRHEHIKHDHGHDSKYDQQHDHTNAPTAGTYSTSGIGSTSDPYSTSDVGTHSGVGSTTRDTSGLETSTTHRDTHPKTRDDEHGHTKLHKEPPPSVQHALQRDATGDVTRDANVM